MLLFKYLNIVVITQTPIRVTERIFTERCTYKICVFALSLETDCECADRAPRIDIAFLRLYVVLCILSFKNLSISDYVPSLGALSAYNYVILRYS